MTRKQAIRILVYKVFPCLKNSEWGEALKMAIKELEEPKTGHWIWCFGSHKCSNCNENTCFSDKNIPKYCPNCGARMSEVEQ